MKKLLLLLFSLFPLAALAQEHVTGTITSTECVTVQLSTKTSAIAIQVTGTWTGTLQPKATIQGNTAANIQVTPSTSSTAQATITANGTFTASVAGYDTAQVCGNTVASGTATVYINASTAGSTASGGGGSGGTVVPGSCHGTGLSDNLTANGSFATTCVLSTNYLKGASKITLQASGTESFQSPCSPGDNQYSIKFGSTTVLSAIGHSSALGNNFAWSINAALFLMKPGASGKITAFGGSNDSSQSFLYQENNTSTGPILAYGTATSSIDTTASQTISIAWGNMTGANCSTTLTDFLVTVQKSF